MFDLFLNITFINENISDIRYKALMTITYFSYMLKRINLYTGFFVIVSYF